MLEEEQDALEEVPEAPPVLSVTQISSLLRKVVEGTFANASVEGEISGLKTPASGHIYLNLKDEDAVLNAIVWRTTASRLGVRLEDGQKVIAHGRLTTYAPRSNYQLIIDRIEAAGEGRLMQLFEELKRKLAAEGLFDEARKKTLPYLPERIGIVTSPTGAVIDDMLHRIADRCPREVLLWPVRVQGDGAKEEIVAAVKGFNALPEDQRPDVLIVARGGGSLEDLWAFNEEVVARTIAGSEIPVISGVGHEPDVTLADFVADVRAPTPSAAAEMVVPVRENLLATLEMYFERLTQGMTDDIAERRRHLTLIQRALPDPRQAVTQSRLRLEDRAERLVNTMTQAMKMKRQQTDSLEKILSGVAPQGVLKRGFAYVTDEQGNVVNSAKTKVSDVQLNFHDGVREASLK